MKRRRRRRGSARRAAFFSAVVLSAWAWLGFSSADEAAVRHFDASARAWQTNPEFRRVAADYCLDGSRALATRFMWVPAGGVVVALRSLPFLPRALAVNPTSALHYRRFSGGPLIAYLHLGTEQSIPTFAGALEGIIAGEPDDSRCGRRFLEAFHMDDPVCADAGAVRSAAALIGEVDPRKPFVVRGEVGPLLLPHIRNLARALDIPESPDDMTVDQQRAVFEALDVYVREHDPELWRTKQLNDFCSGVWAQVFGPSYGYAITPVLLAHRAAGLTLGGLMLWAASGRRRNGRRST
jgi:hypothetical protein